MKKPDANAINDLLKLGETALSVLLGATKEMKSHAMDSRDALVRKLDLVTREEFDVAFAMIKKARQIQDDLLLRLDRLEDKMSLSSPQKSKTKKQIRPKK